MPLKKGTSRETVGKNIREFTKGDTYKATQRKHGTATARRQAIAVAMETKRQSQRKK